jgi:LPXTG-motif cell wall-anchored protein
MFWGVGSRRAAAVALGVLSAAVVGPVLVATMQDASANSTSTATLHAQQQNTTGSDYQHNCDHGPGWIFVLPASQGTAFVSLSATFKNAGTVQGTVLSNPKFASVQVSLSDTILSATAQITGGHQGSTFNITHVCAGDGNTTTTYHHNTTTTTEHHSTTSTSAPETSTSVSSTSTSFEVLGSTTVPSTESTTSTSTPTVVTEGSTLASSTTSTSVHPEGSTVASTASSTTTPGTVVPGGTTTMPFTGSNTFPLVWTGLACIAGGALLLGRRRARRA